MQNVSQPLLTSSSTMRSAQRRFRLWLSNGLCPSSGAIDWRRRIQAERLQEQPHLASDFVPLPLGLRTCDDTGAGVDVQALASKQGRANCDSEFGRLFANPSHRTGIPSALESLDFLIVGAPTYGGRPTPAMKEFLRNLPGEAVGGVGVAAFDTRISQKWVGIFGYAAGKIARGLQKKGGRLVVNPEGFFVYGTEGPLKEGEPERAAAWAKGILSGAE